MITTMDTERTDLLETLAKHRALFRHTLDGLTDEQAASRPTASALCLGGLVKHVAAVEERWIGFILHGPSSVEMGMDPAAMAAHAATFDMAPGETVVGVLERYDEISRRTEAVILELDDLDQSHPLPEAPWFKPGARWTARRVLMHILAETAQHAGHADIIRETIDGAKTMG
jgi:uncharacterized damage-inducible protein DinB